MIFIVTEQDAVCKLVMADVDVSDAQFRMQSPWRQAADKIDIGCQRSPDELNSARAHHVYMYQCMTNMGMGGAYSWCMRVQLL